MLRDELTLRQAGPEDIGVIARLRALWMGETLDPGFVDQMRGWLDGEGERRTTWIASLRAEDVGMASLFEYRRMPKPGRPLARWGYLGNMFVRAEFRNRGIGSALLRGIIDAADARDYARLVLSPSQESVRFYQRAGFVVPEGSDADDRLLVRLGPQR